MADTCGHPATATPAPVGVTRDGVVYELFFTALPQEAFTAADVVNLYLHRGAFETVLSDEDQEQDPDRWVPHAPHGQQVWQILSQWMWNLRLELGHRFHPTPMRLTTFAQAQPLAEAESVKPDPQSGHRILASLKHQPLLSVRILPSHPPITKEP